ncbi:50S ribosomal protein L11 methyltransferase [soil metagenome]
MELSVPANAESVEAVSELLGRYGHNNGVVIEEPFRQDEDGENFEIDPTRPVIVRTFVADDEHGAQQRTAIEQGLGFLRQIGGVGDLSASATEEEDWANSWKQHFQVLRLGRRFVVRPTWREYEAKPGDLVIHLDPGMAFGTGSHPSTEMCLHLMEGLDFGGKSVLDVGAGSGILSVGAMLMGASSVDAVEIDQYAAKALASNVELNDMSLQIPVIVGDIATALPQESRYEVVLANLIARILVENAGNITSRVADGGVIVASGIIEEREELVLNAYREYGFTIGERKQSKDWVALTLVRSG